MRTTKSLTLLEWYPFILLSGGSGFPNWSKADQGICPIYIVYLRTIQPKQKDICIQADIQNVKLVSKLINQWSWVLDSIQLMGLAVYNSINLDVRFPSVCYRKLLSPAVVPFHNPRATVGVTTSSLDDLKKMMPVSVACCLSLHQKCSSLYCDLHKFERTRLVCIVFWLINLWNDNSVCYRMWLEDYRTYWSMMEM